MESGASPLPASPFPSSIPPPGKHSTKYKVSDYNLYFFFPIFFFVFLPIDFDGIIEFRLTFEIVWERGLIDQLALYCF